MTHTLSIPTTDDLLLEGERRAAEGPTRAAVVLCHPHPQYGGTMRSLVISALFDSLPTVGVECLRFNYRGVEGSTGTYGEGVGERLDVVAALDALVDTCAASVPIGLIGWSFGADMALATHDPRVSGWMGIALPMRFVTDADRAAVAADPRPKRLTLAQHDEFRDAEWVVEATQEWTNTRVDIVLGASHFFVGRTDRVSELAADFVTELE